MFSLTYFILHTALIILAFIYPQYIFTFYWITFALVYNLYCRWAYRTIHISRSSLRIIHFLPIVFVAIAFKAAENMTSALLNIILFTYAIVIIINYVVPIVKYLKLRITLYRHVQKLIKEKNYRTSATFREFIFCGANTPHNIVIETPEATITLALLGAVGASRYMFEPGSVIAQRYSDYRLRHIEEIIKMDKFEEDMKEEFAFPKLNIIRTLFGPVLGIKHRRALPFTPETDKALLILPQNSFIQIDDRFVGMGEKIDSYTVVTPKTAMSII